MTQEIRVPAVGESITEGVLVAWLVAEGAWVEAEAPLFELETDKITMEVPSPVAGAVHIEVPAGSTVQVGQRVGWIDPAADRDVGAAPPAGGDTPAASEPSSPSPPEAPAQRDNATTSAAAAPPASGGPAVAPPPAAPPAASPAPPQPSAPTYQGRPGFGPSAPAAVAAIATGPAVASADGAPDLDALSPAVRRLVLEHQLDPRRIPGTGPGGRLTKGDVLSFLAQQEADVSVGGGARAAPPQETAHPAAAPSSAPRGSGTETPRQTRKKMSPLRARIAERLLQATRDAAMLTTFNEADMSRILELRKSLQGPFEQAHGRRLGFMSFFVKAVVDALQRVPALNAYIEGDEIVTNHFYDIGVAVGTDRGLVVPVIRDCDKLGFAEIEAAIADLARRVREKKIGLDELQGGCFTISNGGIYGSLLSTPILNPPQSGILGMHAIKKRPVVVDDEIVIRPMMYLALSYDHRVVDGKEAVTFLKRVVECLEAPERMLLDV